MMAIKNALEIFSGSIKSPAKITIKCDYEGCIKWLSGEWRAKAFYIAQVKEEIETIIKQKKNWEIEFKWVKGHQSIMDNDSYFNNLVDKLAKGI
jgi:ribonuclease HI